MDFISLGFGLFLLIGVCIYYIIPKNRQWIWLLVLGMFFYACASVKLCFFICMSILTSYAYGIFAGWLKKKDFSKKRQKLLNRGALFFVLGGNFVVMFFLKTAASGTGFAAKFSLDRFAFLVPIGISFYTLQIAAYCIDVYKARVEPQRNLFKYALFVSFFPQILQGPIPRYKQLAPQLYAGHGFSYRNITFGLQLILWGFFQKLVIADRANIVVNRIFGEYGQFYGFVILIGGILYSIQLYADFSGCVCIAMGSAQLFGIQLENNFDHPYFADSITDFWHRWHLSLSLWLKDYVYIPLGGNRRGKARKYVNLLITFLVSGIWHGIGLHYVLWGLMHGLYQIIGSLLVPVRDFFVKLFKIDRGSFSHRLFKQMVTFCLVMSAWIVFRADSVSQAAGMFHNLFSSFNPWVFVNGDLYLLGISGMEFRLLVFGIFVMWCVSMLQVHFKKEAKSLREVLFGQHLIFRWIIIFAAVFAVLVFGIYGPGYDAAQFIYGGF